MMPIAIQTRNGKAFEYSLLKAFHDKLTQNTGVTIIDNPAYRTARGFFEEFNIIERDKFTHAAEAAVDFLVNTEPKLKKGINDEDILQLEIVSDQQGQSWDVRDVIVMRSIQNWEIGISAKNNHAAVKHPRLSKGINFGSEWVGITCSPHYFSKIDPIFDNIDSMRRSDPTKKWSDLANKKEIYKWVLDAFWEELDRLDKENPWVVAPRIVEYLIGRKDFYKVIKRKGAVEIIAYNLRGTLGSSSQSTRPIHTVTRTKLPTRISEIIYKDNSSNTLLVTFNEGWQISFRIHSASTLLESSLKFDIKLIGRPESLFTNRI